MSGFAELTSCRKKKLDRRVAAIRVTWLITPQRGMCQVSVPSAAEALTSRQPGRKRPRVFGAENPAEESSRVAAEAPETLTYVSPKQIAST